MLCRTLIVLIMSTFGSLTVNTDIAGGVAGATAVGIAGPLAEKLSQQVSLSQQACFPPTMMSPLEHSFSLLYTQFSTLHFKSVIASSILLLCLISIGFSLSLSSV